MNLTIFFVTIMSLIFILQHPLELVEYFSFIPNEALYRPWTFVTSIFLHANFQHLFFNMLALFFFGSYLESLVSRKTYLIIFFISGIFGNTFFLFVTHNPSIPAVGASGSIYGIIGALAAIKPYAIVYVYFAPMPLIVLAFLWGIISFIGVFIPSSIAHAAHLSGLITGYLIGLIIRKRGARKYKRII